MSFLKQEWYLSQEVEIGYTAEHLDQEDGEEGDGIVLCRPDGIWHMAFHLTAPLDLDSPGLCLGSILPLLVPILAALQRELCML